jgi:hypothetical protein
MAVNKNGCLSQAIEITKEYARGGGPGAIEEILERLYKKLKELAEDSAK